MAFAAEAIDHLDRLYRAALRLTRDRARAENLVEDTYVRALRCQDGYRAGTDMKVWLFAIMRTAFWDRFKGGAPDSLDEIIEEDDERGSELMSLDRVTHEDVVLAIERLPEIHREVVLLVDVEGLTYKECAEVLGVPVETVMSRLHRARSQLQQALVSN